MKNHPPTPSEWRTATAVAPGVRHRRHHAACQDVLRMARIGDQRLLVALGDGAGSATWGGLGAELATAAALARLAAPDPNLVKTPPRERPVGAPGLQAGKTRPFPCRPAAPSRRSMAPSPSPDHLPPSRLRTKRTTAVARDALEAARTALAQTAAQRGVPLRQLATTLLICVAEPDTVVAGQIGDGAVVIGQGDGVWETLTQPASGEYLNETVFVTSDDALERSQVVHLHGPLRELALFSDGLQMLALNLADAAPHTPFFKPLFGWLATAEDPFAARRDLTAFLHSPRVTDRTDDDLSLCLARWTGSPAK